MGSHVVARTNAAGTGAGAAEPGRQPTDDDRRRPRRRQVGSGVDRRSRIADGWNGALEAVSDGWSNALKLDAWRPSRVEGLGGWMPGGLVEWRV